jgi:hypothetical protein
LRAGGAGMPVALNELLSEELMKSAAANRHRGPRWWESAFVRLLSSPGRAYASAGSSAGAGGYSALFTASNSRSIANGLRM